MLIRARIVLPMSGPPLEDGAVLIAGTKIVSVGPWSRVSTADRAEIVDLGEVILMPGWVNAHCHLDYTHMAGKIPPRSTFTDWIKSMVALKAAWSYTDFAHSWMEGAHMLLRTGTTTVADMEAVPELIPEMWGATPLRVVSFRELIHVKRSLRPAEMMRDVGAEWGTLPNADRRIGLSPHATYTTSPELLAVAGKFARARGWRLSTHVAESEEEFQMFMYGAGAMHDWLKKQKDTSSCGNGSPVKHLHRCGYLGDDLLAVHVNYLDRGDADLLANHGVSVAHCPRSHAYFQHLRFPRRELADAGVNICLGTDSLASVRKSAGATPVLSMFAEMRTLARTHTDLSPFHILAMATTHGARALGRNGELGELCPGARADMIALPFTGHFMDAMEAVVQHDGDVKTSMIDGRWVWGKAGD